MALPIHLPLHLPWPARAINRLLKPFVSTQLDASHLIAQAVVRFGKKGEVDEAVVTALKVLVTAYNESADLHVVGSLATKVNLVSLLVIHLQIKYDRLHDQHNQQEKIVQPMVIFGLPRTGSTFLHELLCQDPALRSPLCWETLQPVPASAAKVRKIERKFVNRTKRKFALLGWLAPEFASIHKLKAQGPQECLCLFAPFMVSCQFMAASFVPAYQAWLDTADQRKIYASHKEYLQHLQAGEPKSEPPRRWCLKAPSHMRFVKGLHEAYPDLKTIMTHRTPVEVIPSIASLHLHLYKAFSNYQNKETIGRWVCNWWAQAWHITAAYRQQNLKFDTSVLDIAYEDLLSEPLAVAQKIYDHCGITLTQSVKSRMKVYVDENRQGKHGGHQYTLAEFGLSKAEVRRAFEAGI